MSAPPNDHALIDSASLQSSIALFKKSVRKSRGFAKCGRLPNRRQVEVPNTEAGCKRNRDESDIGECSSAMSSSRVGLQIAQVPLSRKRIVDETALIYRVGCDTMASILSYLQPVEAHKLLFMPLSKTWRSVYTQSENLWKILCLTEPFNANYSDISGEKSDDSCPLLEGIVDEVGRFRLVYTSFVQCTRYVERIKLDAQKGRPPSSVPTLQPIQKLKFHNSNSSLSPFLAKAQLVVESASTLGDSDSEDDNSVSDEAIGVSDDGIRIDFESSKKKGKEEKSGVRFSHSVLTERLLKRPKLSKAPGFINLPWSCAVYSIINWMASFADVEGIQIKCLEAIPDLLEDDKQRSVAQNAGLIDIILTDMLHFPNSVKLHVASFHALVLLARPLGGREGMLLQSSTTGSNGSYFTREINGKNGISIMIESMKRFASSEMLQAMACWAMVNISLISDQKATLVRHGGITAAVEAMLAHPLSAEVQFRALFSLINLVIPPESLPESDYHSRNYFEEALDKDVHVLASLAVLSMKNFGTNIAIINRACLVLHNLSLVRNYHSILLLTPDCFQLLRSAMLTFRTDKVLQQSAGGALRRLRLTLSADVDLRNRFFASISMPSEESGEA